NSMPADFPNLSPLYGAILDTVVLDLDNITADTKVDLDVTAEVQAAITAGAAKITFGLTSPDAIATGARNFFAFEGLDQGGGGGSIGPNLQIDGNFTVFDPADVNMDGAVSTLDFQQISDDLFKLTADLTGVNINSDIDESGLVDFTDFRIWKNTPQGSAVFASMQVPEPTSVVLLCGAAMLITATIRRKRG
ncbi:MAG: PEP-CTERM sorting domain-containing protein, partial [Bythopirellula sp.]